MSQEIINVGASANDGQGDPIRTAFEKTNNNFTQLFGIGASQIIYNGTSNVNIPFLNGNVFISVGGVSNVMVVDPTGANISGKLAVTGNVTGGNLLTGGAISSAGTITGVTVVGDYIQGIITTASQTQITALGTLGSLSVSANVQAGNVRSSGTVSAVGGILAGANVFGTNLKASGLMSVTGSATAGNIFTSGSLSATSNITGGNVLTGGLISATGNIRAGNIIANNIGNIAALNLNGNASTILYGNGVFAAAAPSSSYGNSNVTTLLSNLGSNTISTTANVTGNYFLGNGSQLTSLPAPVVTQDITSNGAMSIMTYDGVIKYVNYATVEPSSGNIAGGNISATGNITGNYFIGDGSQLTNLPGGSSNYIVNGNSYANIATANGNLVVNVGTDGYGTWTFETGTGNLVGPGNASQGAGIVLSADQSVYIREDMGQLNIDAGSDIVITTNSGNVGNTQAWTFGTDGTTTFPTANIDLHNGGVQSGEVLQFGNSSLQAIITGPTPSANVNAQRLIIQGQRGNGTGEGGDVYVWAGDSDTNGGDIKIYAGDADNVSAGNGGYINLAGGDGFDNGGDISLDGGSSANGTGGTVSIDGGYGETDGGTVSIDGGYGETDGGSASLQGGYGATGQGGVVQITGGGSGNGTGSFGNVVLGSGSSGWIFDNTGNLTLPDNTFAVNYANGTPVSIGGSGANTGNVTFDNQVVVGTGDSTGSGGLYLAPGNASIANSAVQYLRVRGGDAPTHIHFDTGNNQYFDQYFGDDFKYVKLEASGNVVIGSNDGSNSAQWTFDTAGNLSIPGNINSSGNSSASPSLNDFFSITSAANFAIVTDNANTDQTWTFDSAGALTVPGGGAVFTVGTGTIGVTANATSGNAYLGLDDPSSAATLYGNAGVQIGTNANVSWNFQSSGNLTLPDGGLLGTTYGYTALQAGNTGGLLIQNANCYIGVSPDESFTVVAASQAWTFSNANAAATLQCPVVAYAALPAATYAAGLRAFINNSNASSFGQVVDGSGAYTVPVWSDGADWRVG